MENSKLNQVVHGIKDHLNALLPELKTCAVHSGRFDETELKNISTQAPALFTTVLGLNDVTNEANEQQTCNYQFAVFIVTKDQNRLSKDDAARNLVEVITQHLRNQRWGHTHIGVPTHISAKNLYSAQTKNNHTLWVVTWLQTLTTCADVFDQTGYTVPVELYADTHIGDDFAFDTQTVYGGQ